MKLSKSKLALAKVINENGGWVDDSVYAANDEGGIICGYSSKPIHRKITSYHWSGSQRETWIRGIKTPQWHQCVLSREEYYQAYPKADADEWIEWKGGMKSPVESCVPVDVKTKDGYVHYDQLLGDACWRDNWGDANIISYRLYKPDVKPEFCESVMRSIPEPGSIDWLCAKVTEENKHQHVDAKPTIEQLAQDYRNAKDYAVRLQKEADDAARSADAKLRELERAGESIGLIIGIAKQESAPVIIDWRDLKVGDEIRCIGDWQDELTDGLVLKVDDVEIPDYRGELAVRVLLDGREGAWGKDFEFISRP